ncbi:MAG: hypothetical protein LIO58_02075 [Oscillospiraceae bacterium]|nr:hypothetical protein [Oscillospiraceae bacterium]
MQGSINSEGVITFLPSAGETAPKEEAKIAYKAGNGIFPNGGIVYEQGTFLTQLTARDVANIIKESADKGLCDQNTADKFCEIHKVNDSFRKALTKYMAQ